MLRSDQELHARQRASIGPRPRSIDFDRVCCDSSSAARVISSPAMELEFTGVSKEAWLTQLSGRLIARRPGVAGHRMDVA